MKKNSFLFALLSVCLLSSFAWAGGYTVQGVSGEFKFRTDITIDETKVDADLTDFSVLVKLTSSNFNFSYLEDSTGARIRFTASIDAFGNGTGTLLKYERERFDSTNQVAEIWVKVPSVSSSTNTTFYMFYGNSTDIGDGQDASNVWDSNFQAVWHLKEDPSVTAPQMKDSTLNVNHGTSAGTMTTSDQVAGQVDGSLDFDGTDDRIDTANFMSSGITQVTAEAWVFKTATKDARIVYKNNAGNTGAPVFGLASGGTDTVRARLRISDSSYTDYNVSTISLNTWTFVAFTYDGSNVRVYKNGVEAGYIAETGTLAATSDVVVIAQNEAGTSVDRHWPGKIDEVRLSNTARSAAWIKASYNSGNDTLVTLGSPNPSFSYKKQITIDYTKVAAALTGFPVLISLSSDSELAAKAQDDGDDINFRDASLTRLNHEIEYFNGTTGQLVAWVKCNLSSSTNTVIWMYYGNSLVGSMANASGVWDSNFQAVWHLKEDPSVTAPQMKDSTSNANHGTSAGTMTTSDQVAGQVDGSLDFDGINDRIDTANFMSSGITALTAQAWVYKAATKDCRIVYKNNAGNTGHPVFGLCSGGTDTIRARVRISDGSGTDYNVSTISLNTWTFVAFTYDGANVRVYKNGVEAGYIAETGTLAATADVIVIAQNEAGTSVDRHWPGKIDEVRLSNTARSAGWLLTEYNNQSSPSTFYSLGGELTVIDLAYFRAKGQNSAVLLEWETKAEIENEGFNILRSEGVSDGYIQVNPLLIPSKGKGGFGADYSLLDDWVINGVTYYYLLEDVDFYGRRSVSGPVSATPHDIQLIWPEDGELLAVDAYLFCWRSANFSSFKVDLSFSESFPDSNTVSFPRDSWTQNQYLYFTVEALKRLSLRAEVEGSPLFWQVRAQGENGENVSSDARRLFLYGVTPPAFEEKKEQNLRQQKVKLRKN